MNISEEININDITGDLTVGSTLTVDDTLNKVGINHTPTASSATLQVTGGFDITGDLVVDTNSLLVDSALNKVGIKHVPIAASSDFTVSGSANISGALDCGELQLPVAAPAANNSGNIYASTDKIHVYDSAWKSFSSDAVAYAHYEQTTTPAQTLANNALNKTNWDGITQRGGFALGGAGLEFEVTFPKTGLYNCCYTMTWAGGAIGDPRQSWIEYKEHRHALVLNENPSWASNSASCVINVDDITEKMFLASHHVSSTAVTTFIYTDTDGIAPKWADIHPSLTVTWIGDSV